MSVQKPTIPTATQARGIDLVVVDLQTHLSTELVWLTYGMGRAYTMKKVRGNGTTQFLPYVYLGVGNNEPLYHPAVPDNDNEGQSFIIVGNGSYVNFQRGHYGVLEYPVSIIFAANLGTNDAALLATENFTEHLMENVRQALTRDMLGKAYTLVINEETQIFDEVYAEFDINTEAGRVSTPLLPMTYFRFNCTVQVRESCPALSLNRCGAILQNLTADDKNTCILPTYDFSSTTVQANVTGGQQADLITWLCVSAPIVQTSISFDALNEYINAYNKAAYSAFDWNKPFSFTTWVRFTDVTAVNAIIGKRTGAFMGFLFILNGGNIVTTIRDTGSTGIVVATDTTTLVNNTWYQLGISYDGSTNASGVSLSVDGVDVSTATTSDTLGGTILNSADLSFGQSLGNYLGGQMGYVRGWDIELSAANKLADYNLGVMNDTTIQEPNLVVGWKSGVGALFGTTSWLFPDLEDDTSSPASVNMAYSNRLLDVPV